MLDRAGIARLIPHHGTMCLLDAVISWSHEEILCRATSHLARDNPLRRAGHLGAVAGIEYALQAAALHGALSRNKPQPRAWLASLRAVNLHTSNLDDPAVAHLLVDARMAYSDSVGMIYDFRLRADDGRLLVDGRATIALPRRGT